LGSRLEAVLEMAVVVDEASLDPAQRVLRQASRILSEARNSIDRGHLPNQTLSRVRAVLLSLAKEFGTKVPVANSFQSVQSRDLILLLEQILPLLEEGHVEEAIAITEEASALINRRAAQD
jgi:hypothetical protein